MSLLLNGARTATIAGTQLQLVEIYNGESYTFPFNFKDSSGAVVNITGWTLTPTCKWYNATLVYPNDTATQTTVTLSNLALLSPQPAAPAGLTAAVTDGPNGVGYLFIPTTINGGQTFSIDAAPALIAVVTLTVSRTDAVSSFTDINKEPIGFIIRYL
jgi:hypothetical protein